MSIELRPNRVLGWQDVVLGVAGFAGLLLFVFAGPREHLHAAEVITSIIADVDAFCGDAPRHDDVTMVAIRVLGKPGPQEHEAAA